MTKEDAIVQHVTKLLQDWDGLLEKSFQAQKVVGMEDVPYSAVIVPKVDAVVHLEIQ